MKLLLNLIFASALFGLIAATPDDSARSKSMAAPIQVTCGNLTWTDGEELGEYNGKKVWTYIFQNRIYLKRQNDNNNIVISDNKFILFQLNTGRFPNNPQNDAMLKSCVNVEDPSTYSTSYLKNVSPGVISCSSDPKIEKRLTDRLFLGAYIGGDGVKTLHYAVITDGLLRIALQREPASGNFTGYNMSLIQELIDGSNGSYFDSNLGFKFTIDEVKHCFWPDAPLTAIPVTPNQNCPGGPSLQSISNISKTALRFVFTGSGVPNVKWRIKSGNSEVRNGTTGQLSGNTTVDLSFSSLDAGNYSLEIEGGDCNSSVSSQSFTVINPVVVVPQCNGGPTVSNIRNITSNSLTVDFGGNNIPNLSWKIKSGSTLLYAGKTGNLNSNTTGINFDNLINGTYTLEIQGGDCISGVSSSNFTVSANCAGGPVLQEVGSITGQGLNFLFDGNGVYGIDWKIVQGANLVRQNSVSPQSNRPSISFETIPSGIYTLVIQGGTCNSATSSMSFSLNAALPIYIASFQATVVKKGIALSWKVVSEKDGEGFEIMRLNNELKTSEVIGKMALTDQRTGDYQFLDENPLSGINYYQLKQIDKDGSFMNSKIVTARFDQLFEVMVSPNPANEFVNIQFTSRSSGVTGIEVYNMAGIKLSASQINLKEGNNTYRINVGKLTDGHYFVKVLNGDQSSHLRFVKVN